MSFETLKQEVEQLDNEIKGTEARIKSIMGTGAKAKREALERDLPDKRTLLKNKQLELSTLEKKIKKEGPPKEVIPKGWVKATQQELDQWQKDGRLAGYDPEKKLALLN